MISSLTSRFEFANRRALFLSTHKAAVYHWNKGELGSSYLFDTDQDGRIYFERYLRETPNIPFYIMVDIFEEEYKQDTIPHVLGSDRAALLERKKTRLFRDTPYQYHKVQGRETEGRRDDKIFLSALTNPDVIKPWASLLEKYKAPLVGTYSLALFTESLIPSIPNPSNNMLVVSLQSISGLRQTFFHNKEFRISRLVQLPRYGTTSYAPHIHEEVEKIQRYLNSLRLISPDESLNIYFLFAGELLEEAKKDYADSSSVKYHFLDLNELLKESKVSTKVSTPFSDQYFVYNLLKLQTANQYATSEERRYSTMRRMRYAMLVSSIFLIIGGIIWSGFNFVGGLMLKQSSLDAERKTQFYTTRYEIARERLPKTPVEPADLKVAVEIADTLEKYRTSPIKMVKQISRSLNKFPSIKLDTFDWESSIDPNLQVGAGNINSTNQNIIGFSNVGYTDTGYFLYQIAKIDGHLDPFDGNFREAIATINKFAETLRKGNAVHDVSIVSLPLDVSSTASLQGNTRTINKQANFSIRVVLGIANEL